MDDPFQEESIEWLRWGRSFEELSRQHPLRVLFWQTTLACDSSCYYCSSPKEWWKPGQQLTTEEICNTLQQIAKDFDLSTLSQLAFTGGEPLLRKDLAAVVSRATELGYPRVAIQTNGRIATKLPTRVEELIAAGAKIWGVNIDGPLEVHDAMRQRGHWYEEALSFADRICNDSRLTTTITTLVSKKNYQFLPEVHETVLELNPDIWRIALFDPIGRGAESSSEYTLAPDELRQVVEYIAEVRAFHESESFETEIACGGWLGREWEGIVRPFVFHCVSGLDTMTILYDGGITGCPVVSRKLIQGNVRDDRVHKIWNERFQYFRNASQRAPKKCLSCSDWRCCHGGCMHNFERLEQGWETPFCLRDQVEGGMINGAK